MKLQLEGILGPPWLFTLGLSAAFLAWWLYRRTLAGCDNAALRWTLPSLRAAAVLLLIFTLAEPTLELQQREGQPGQICFILDSSASMSLQGGDQQKAPVDNRYGRAANILFDEQSGLVPQLSDRFDLKVSHGGNSLTTIFDSTQNDSPATIEPPVNWADDSALGTMLRQTGNALSGDSGSQRQIVVLLSDGQNNSGDSPVEVARELIGADQSVFTVAIGADQFQRDIALESAEGPQRVYAKDTFRGLITVTETLPIGSAYGLSVEYDGTQLWEQQLTSEGLTQREIAYSFPVQRILDEAYENQPEDSEFFRLPVRLDVQVTGVDGGNTANDQLSIYSEATVQEAKVLLVDGRSRWEARYLRNLFTRDPAWQIRASIHSPSDSQNTTDLAELERQDLFEFHLLIVGDVPASQWSEQQLDWVQEFVELGGGLIFIDGAREHLRGSGYQSIADLLPIKWEGSAGSLPNTALPKRLQVTSEGEQFDFLRLGRSVDESWSSWQRTQPIQFLASIKPQAGSQVLVEATSDLETVPVWVLRRYGAGKVLYVGTDESWKLRHRRGDEYHAQLWNQTARAIMRSPYSLRSDYLSLDTGRIRYEPEESIPVRCELRDAGGMPLSASDAYAVIIGAGVQRRVPLVQDPLLPGTYRGSVTDLPSGDYDVQIEATGLPSDALQLSSPISVVSPPAAEMRNLSCNRELLAAIAQAGGGQLVGEAEADTLIEILNPLSGGRILRQTYLVWTTYWWFAAAISVLAIEWWIRKRAGLS